MHPVTRTNAKSSHQGQSQYWQLICLGTFFIFLLTTGSRRMNPKQEQRVSLQEMSTKDNMNIVMGSVNNGLESIGSYQCNVQGVKEVDSGDDETIDLILLHGAKFTKEDWKKSGLLEKFCSNPTQKLRVTALDLSHTSDFRGLKSTIDAMRQNRIIHPTKKIAIVTPSASGHSMVNWAENDQEGMINAIEYWIPVACPSVIHAETNVLQKFTPLNILAIHGSEDTLMMPASEQLEKYAGAKVKEIEGGHPCYFDSPGRFVEVVSNFIQKS